MKRRYQPREPTEEEQELYINVKHCARELDDILQGARRKSERNNEVFAQSHVVMLQRGVSTYAHLYDKLGHLSREQLERDLNDHSKCDEVQNAHEDILETEGLWSNFLENLDRELHLDDDDEDDEDDSSCAQEGDKLSEAHLSMRLVDWKSRTEVTLKEMLKSQNLLLLLCQPAYLPPVIVRWYLDQLLTKEAHFRRFKLQVAIVLWGNKESTSPVTLPLPENSATNEFALPPPRQMDPHSMAKEWLKLAKLPGPENALGLQVYFDADRELIAQRLLPFRAGLRRVWSHCNIQFYGQQQCAGRAVHPPLEHVRWSECLELGGALLLSKSGRVIVAQASDRCVSELPSLERVYDAALSKYARSLGQNESDVRKQLRLEHIRHCAPDMGRLQFHTPTGMYYDPETEYYYDSASQYFYDPVQREYLYWSAEQGTYVSAQPIMDAAQQQYEAMQQYYAAQVTAYDVAIEEARRKLQEEEEAERILRETAVQVAIAKAQQEKGTAVAAETSSKLHEEQSQQEDELKPPGT